MRKFVSLGIIAAAVLTACSHGSQNTLPATANTGAGAPMSAFMRDKIAKEEQRDTSTFVAPKHPGYVADAPESRTWPTGIHGDDMPVPGGVFDIVNQYDAVKNGQYVTVYAGSLKTTGAGIVLVVTRSTDLHTVTPQLYTVAPSAVRITSATDGQLQLQTLSSATPEHGSIPFRLPL
jgi:hypothetical protein